MSERKCVRWLLSLWICAFGILTAAPQENIPVKTETATKPAHTNRLEHETSPYLLQHAHNPVNWYPWGDEALKKARSENKPIFLSIGYSACHWCHVMERESFENEDIAAVLNQHFVSIKVDREERPDLDEIYMTAVQIMTGSGGWPMSVFLTPELKPFYGGTYYPPVDMYGRPGFKTVLLSIAQAWEERRAEVDKSADQLTQYVQQSVAMRTGDETAVGDGIIKNGVTDLARSYDATYGGFGPAPKFPSSPGIELLLRQYAHTGDEHLLEMATFTLTKMYRGGMYDHLGGGFHRYSVDARWLVPHFEKMLYDNAQLVQVYLAAYQVTQNPLFARVARETLDYELRDMQDARGAFRSTEDADSEGEEGKFYVWKRDEIMRVLGGDDGTVFCQYYCVKPAGNFESHESYHDGQNILHIERAPETVAKDLNIPVGELEKRLAGMRAKLLDVRNKRARPGLDDKVLTSWNGLIISALAQGYQVLGDARYKTAAERAADYVLTEMTKDGTLLRSSRNGDARHPGYLDDYAFMANALVDLYEATFDVKWLDAANGLAGKMLDRFWDSTGGSFYFTTADHRDLLMRTKPTYDGAEPSGNSMAAFALLRLGRLTGQKRYADTAERVLKSNQANMTSAPRGYLKMLCAADFYLTPTKEIAIAGPSDSAPVTEFLQALHMRFVPNKVVAVFDPKLAGAATVAIKVPLLEGKTLVDGSPAAYVCKNFACQKPVTSATALMELIGANSKGSS